jgi:uncharacterized protein YndB with AHSA1/START domain
MSMLRIHTHVQRPIATVWHLWTEPEHICKWNAASPDWHTTQASNDVHVGGRFSSIMAAKDGSMSFDFCGQYTAVTPHQHLAYTLDDGRRVTVDFQADDTGVTIVSHFEPEQTHPPEFQQAGWQAILQSFADYAATQAV